MAEVTERWSARSFRRGVDARRAFDITGVTNEEQARSALWSEQSVGVGSTHPLDSRMAVPTDGIRIDGGKGNRNFVGTVEYASIVPGGITSGDDESNLLNQKWRIVVDPETREEPIERDYQKNPFVNSARTPYAQFLMGAADEVIIDLWRWESTYELSKHLAYRNRWNSASIVLPRMGTAAAGELLCKFIKPRQEIYADDGPVAVVYRFIAKPRYSITNPSTKPAGSYVAPYTNFLVPGFYTRRQDLGRESYNATGKAPITLVSDGSKVTVDVALNGYGIPLNSTDYNVGGAAAVEQASAPTLVDVAANGVFLLYDSTDGPIDFAGLNLTANN